MEHKVLTVEPIPTIARNREIAGHLLRNAETVQHLMINSPTCLHLDICQKCSKRKEARKKEEKKHFSEPGPTHPLQFIALDTSDFLFSKNLLFFFFLLHAHSVGQTGQKATI